MEDLNALRVFVEVVRCGSFAAAARSLTLPRSTVSRWVGELEQRLGVRLLQRTTRRHQLTEVGQGYFLRAEKAVASADEATAWAQGRASQPQGLLRIATFQLFADTLLGPILVEYLAQNPGVSVQVISGERDVDLVEDRIDLAIRIGPQGDSSLVVRKLAGLEGRLVAHPSYLAEHGEPSHPSALVEHSCVVYGHAASAQTLGFHRGEDHVEVAVQSRCMGNSIRLVHEVTRSGLGIGLLPAMLARADLASGRLVRVLPTWDLGAAPIFAAYPSRAQLPQKVRALVDLLVARVTPDAVQGLGTAT